MLGSKACMKDSIPAPCYSFILFARMGTPSFRVGSFDMELYSSAYLELELLFLWVSLYQIQGLLPDALLPIQNLGATSTHHLYLQRGEPGMMCW